MEWLIKKGNTAILELEIEDKDGVAIDNLAAVIEANFQLKTTKEALTAELEVTLGNGIEVDTPTASWVRITLRPIQTNVLSIAKYYIGLQLKWSDAEIEEIDIIINGYPTDTARVKQDVVRNS